MKNMNDEPSIKITPAVMRAECAHCGRFLGYRTCAPERRHTITHGVCLPFCTPMLKAGWEKSLEQHLLDKRPWVHTKSIV